MRQSLQLLNALICAHACVLCGGPLRAQEAVANPGAADHDFFEKRVRPILANRCWECHGADQQESELRLDSRDGMLDGGTRGPAIVPGQPEKSLLVGAINHADTLQMPPKEKLPLAEIADLTTWVKTGASWPGSQSGVSKRKTPAPDSTAPVFTDQQRMFWAFQPVADPPPPVVQRPHWPQSPLDPFILAPLESRGFEPASSANKRTLLRRATFDLLGLPPKPDEVESFVADESPDAFARLLDRLLASPCYGERWGRHWLDVARYGDSNGLDENLSFASAFRYRDYVVAALNRDKPYDQFVREQIAGDLLPARRGASDLNEDPHAAVVATGFLVIGAKMLAEDDPLKMQMDIVDEQVDTIGKAFLGLTLGCARCHDHKFDPLPMADYYSLAGIFKSTKTMENFSVVARWQERPLASPDELTRIQQHQDRIAAKQNEVNQIVSRANDELLADARRHVANYIYAAARQMWLDRVTKSFGMERDKNPQGPLPTGVQVIEAESYQRGNALKLTTGYGEGIGVILSNGNGGWTAEFDLVVPAAGLYQLETRYAAAGSRPVEISINGRVVQADGLKEVTGSWNPDTQKWHLEGQFEFKAGANTIRLFRVEPFPHIDKLLIGRVEYPKFLASGGRQPADSPAPGTREPSAGLHPPLAGSSDEPTSLRPAFVTQWQKYLEKAIDDANSPLPEWRELLTQFKQPNFVATPDAARQLFELSTATGKALTETEAAWQTLKSSPAGKDATALSDARQEALRKLLYDISANAPLAVPKNVEEYYAAEAKTSLQQRRDELKPILESLPKPPEAMAVSEGTIEDLPLHLRGNHTSLGKEKLPRRFPRILAGDQQPPIGSDRSGRLEFAQWLTRPEHPLTSRVMVNRLWQWHFGEGLVRSPDNFGSLGERPTHPELLDWLSRRFVEDGWSTKAMHRRIMLSSTYQQSSQIADCGLRIAESPANNPQSAIPNPQLVDPENRLWWRRNRRRLEAEAIRDSILAVGGSLDLRTGGSLLPTPNRQYVTSTANVNPQIYDSPRRSIYLPVVRSALFEVLQAFDFAEPSVLNGKRDTTIVAPQALFMMNSAIVAQQSKELARNLLARTDLDDTSRVQTAYLRLYSRPPSAAEVSRALAFVQRFTESAGRSTTGVSTDALRAQAWQSLCRSLIAANEFVYVE